MCHEEWKKRATWRIYSVLYIYTMKVQKRVVHFRLPPRGHGPQIKQDNVHMKKRRHHHWTCISPFITQLTASFIFSSLPSNPDLDFPFITAYKSTIMQHFGHHFLRLRWCTTPVYIHVGAVLLTGTFKNETGRKRRRNVWTSFYLLFFFFCLFNALIN